MPHLTNLDVPSDEQIYEAGPWRIRSHWFDPDSTDPAKPPLLEVSLVRIGENGKDIHYWFYRPGKGCDIYPEYNGWRVHAWIG